MAAETPRTLGEEGVFAAVLEQAHRDRRAAQARAVTPPDPAPVRCGLCGWPSSAAGCRACADVPDQYGQARW